MRKCSDGTACVFPNLEWYCISCPWYKEVVEEIKIEDIPELPPEPYEKGDSLCKSVKRMSFKKCYSWLKKLYKT